MKTKRILLAVLAMCLPFLASAQKVEIDGICYDINVEENTAKVVRKGSALYWGEIVIPSSVTYQNEVYNVTSIGYEAFSRCSSLTSITIPYSVTSIGSNAFYGCSGLTSVTIPNGVTSIGSNVFSGCSGLTSVTIPNGVTSIDSKVFYGCKGLTSVTIPNSVTSIGSFAFSGCSGLTSVTIPNGVTSIGNNAFQSCSSLTSLIIPNSVTSIGNGAFSFCSGLISIKVENGNAVYDSRDNCNAIIKTTDNALLKGCNNTVIPNSVTSIGNSAFYGCSGLTSVTIPNGVTDIGSYAFSYCSGLTSVTIPNSVTSIGEEVFSGCSGLTSVTIPNGVTSIGSSAFKGCSGLTSVTIPNGVISIGNYFFSGCSGLTSVTIPNGVRFIGSYAFYGCSGLTSVTIPNSVTDIGSYAFSYCSGLTSVTIPNRVTYIGDYAFSCCSGLTLVTIPNSVTSIGNGAFYKCSDICYFYSFSKKVFTNAFNWKEEYFDTDTGGSIDTYETDLHKTTFFVYSNLRDYYRKLNPLKVQSIDFTVNGVFYEMIDYDDPCVRVFGTDNSTNEIKIESSVNLEGKEYIVSSIAEGAFKENVNITSVSIPNSVTTIPAYSFYGCSSLTSVTIGNGVTTIGDYAFSYCSGLTSVSIPNSVTTIPAYSFYGCSSLTSVTIGNGVTTIGDYAFYGCKSLESAEIGTNVGNIKERAFANIDKLNIVTCHSPSVPNTDRTAFENSYVDYVSLFVPEESVDDYKSTAPWSGFKSIKGKSFAAYTLTYMVDGEVYKTQTYEEGDAITPESAPTKDGYIFSGWEGLPEIMPAEDVTVNGTFTEIPPEKCCAPTIAISNGEIVFACETDGVTYHYDVKSLDDKTGEGHSIKLTNTYRVSVYASKEGFTDSDVATKDIQMQLCDANGDGVTNAADIVYVTNRILNSR